MRIFVVGMPGAGNLGDDLISVFLVRHIAARWPGAQIGLLTHGQQNSFPYPSDLDIYQFQAPRRRSWEALRKRRQALKTFLKDTDLILIGGGGLFQDSHSPFTSHKWLQYVYLTSEKQVAAAVGIGLGPFQHRFSQWYLRSVLERLTLIQARDSGSQKWASKLGFNSVLAPDIVLGSDVAWSAFGEHPVQSGGALGCSIRPWPGQQIEQIVSLVATVCCRKGLKCSLFVFEHAEPNNTEEDDFARLIALRLNKMGVEAEIYCYNRSPISEFARAFVSVSCAIASRYHANILWQKIGKPVIPLAYAPKVKSLYIDRGAKVVPVENIDVAQAATMFQRISCEESYSIPLNLTALEPVPDLGKAKVVVKATSIVENGFGVVRSMHWRIKRVLKRKRIDAGI